MSNSWIERIRSPLHKPAPSSAERVEVASGILADAARRFVANRLAVLGALVAATILLAAVFADVLSPQGRDVANFAETLQFPSAQHPLGTDAVGRDFLSRVLHGARTSMLVGLSVPILAALVGIPLGALAGWRGGLWDFTFLRIVEVMTAIPVFIIAIILVTIWGGSPEKLILFLVIIGWIEGARLGRAQVIGLKQREFVLSARALGASDLRVLAYHILPNAAGPMIVAVVVAIPVAIFAEAGLSVLGLGVTDPIPSWGKMIADGTDYNAYWHLSLIPIALIAVTMLAFTFVADGLRDALDPHSGR